ncbi:hypothetical protein EMPS_04786 [Entomortierella parvispora]|uniref:alpha-1,2-Mannosidase n=1 Tax=Entomortierella parvispora TaxID=205924 RepID=A0A9P3LVX2_9FUNG|nr:hypothetical protein EMPS_04786 [Entomortierella parvispora]
MAEEKPTSFVVDIEQARTAPSPNRSTMPASPPSPTLPIFTRPPTTTKKRSGRESPCGPFSWLVQLLNENPTAVRSGRYSIKFRQILALVLMLLVLGGLWFSKSESFSKTTPIYHTPNDVQEGSAHQKPSSDDFWIHPIVEEPPKEPKVADVFRLQLSGKALERYDRVRGKNTFSSLPKIQHSFQERETDTDRFVREQRLEKIREGFEHAWKGYKAHAWGHDEVVPTRGGHRDSFGGWGATIVDSLDTLVIMGFNEEFDEALEWVKTEFDMTKNPTAHLSFFETTIRYLGGFLSAYDLTGEEILLQKATELGDYLLNAFVDGNEFPSSTFTIDKPSNRASGIHVLAEIGTIQVEFTRLSALTGNPIYDQKAQNIIDVLSTATSDLPGILPSRVPSGKNKSYQNFKASIGGMADSYYEYLLKEWILLDGKVAKYRDMFEMAMTSLKSFMVSRPDNGSSDYAIVGQVYTSEKNIDTQMDHLSCFIAGSLAMGSKYFDRPEDLILARQVAEACYLGYRSSETGLGPETMQFSGKQGTRGDVFISEPDTFYKRGQGSNVYILRPETVESLWILYRLTGDKRYQDKAWEIFEALQKHSRTDIAYSGLMDVNQVRSYDNKMERTQRYFS